MKHRRTAIIAACLHRKTKTAPNEKAYVSKADSNQGAKKAEKAIPLKMVGNPDITKTHTPNYCCCCGKNLENIPAEYKGKRQVYDIPEIKIKVTEHRIYTKQCCCGHANQGGCPAEASSPVSYGNNIESLIGYFHTRQYIPFKRIKEIFSDVFNASISEGGIHYVLDRLVSKAQPAYELIKQELQTGAKHAVGSDETGVKVDGDKYWAWTWQNEEATFITITDNRGQKSIDHTFKEGFKDAVLVHDCWASHFNTGALSHQLCLAHLLRDLNYLDELYGHKWSRATKLLLRQALDLEKQLAPSDYYRPNPKIFQIESRLGFLLGYKLPADKNELATFQKRLNRYRDFIFTFLYRPEVPPDNNASERAIRNIKVKQKVSGQFRSTNGAFRFAVLRSITDTVLKNNMNVLNSLKIIASLQTDL